MNELLIGTSGYDYPEWKGVFYPLELKRKDFLSYYATKFNALELNNTFYSMPTAQRLLSFYERSEGKLNFSIKVNRLLTHEITSSWQIAANDFRTAVSPLMQKGNISALLFQLPESFHYTPDNRIYLSKLLAEFSGFPLFVEFRHKEWLRKSVFEGLNKIKSGLVFCDMPQLKNLPDGKTMQTPFIGENTYIRLHGRNSDAWYAQDLHNNGSARYCYDYTDEELNLFKQLVITTLKDGKKVQLFFNNHPNGKGTLNGISLKEKLTHDNFFTR